MVDDRASSQRAVAEDVIFHAGRPVLVFNAEKAPLPSASPKCVAIAWDGSRCAARAVSDAIYLLKAAEDARVFTIVGEKPSAKAGVAKDLVRHLRMYGVEARVDEVEGATRSIGVSIDHYLNEVRPDLLVMGAYGSSRLKEFILGGATEHILNKLRCPALLSH
jgi:nucleotide-binding universal stress UspA family protein